MYSLYNQIFALFYPKHMIVKDRHVTEYLELVLYDEELYIQEHGHRQLDLSKHK